VVAVLAATLVVGAAVQGLVGLGLGVTGGLEWSTFLVAMLTVPCLVVGFVVSRALHRVVPRHRVRAGVLIACGSSAVVLLVRSLF
jgi:hypothetical protein